MADGKKKAELKTALSEIVSQAKMLSYGGGEEGTTWYGFYFTDRNVAENSVTDRYSNNVRFFDQYSGVGGMHIEHSLPKSWWGSLTNNAYKDLHHLFPADGTANSTKNNLPLGETNVPTFDNGVTKVGPNSFNSDYTLKCFEPADVYKGDFARAYLYVSTAYENFAPLWNSPMMDNNTYPVWRPWAIDLLLKWHREDPVSELERSRMEIVYSIQGNRNPFVDYPKLVEHIWGVDTLDNYFFPPETEPFLITPNRWTTVNFGVILKNDIRKTNLVFRGVNLREDLAFSYLNGSKGFSTSVSTLAKEDAMDQADVEISFSATKAGRFVDTLKIEGGGLVAPLLIPLKVIVSSSFVALNPTEVTATKANLNWMKNPDADDYLVDLYMGDAEAGDLFFSGYMEGSGWNKAVEIYNGTGHDVDLSTYVLKKQNNGIGDFMSDYPLSGVLANGSTYLIVHGSASAALLAKAQLVTTTDYKDIMAFNGNDAMALFRDGIMIDLVGFESATETWGEDVTYKRKTSVTHPKSEFDLSEWNVLPVDDWTAFGTHAADFVPSPVFILNRVPVGNVTSYQTDNLTPSSKYTYRIYAHNPELTDLCKNTVQIYTTKLVKPLSLEASDVTSTSFVANWETDIDAKGYLLDVFMLKGNGIQVETESFDQVGADGKPLPEGWNSTITGNYTSSTNSGLAVPSVAFKSNGELLQTKTYSAPVTNLTFMQKFVSGGIGSNLLVEALFDGVWKPVDTIYFASNAKTYPNYSFAVIENVTAFRFTYNKIAGNCAVDDVSVTYGNMETVYVEKDKLVTEDKCLVQGLAPFTEYFYTIRSISGDFVSSVSDRIAVSTLNPVGLSAVRDSLSPFAYSPVPHLVCVVSDKGVPLVLYDLFGRVLATAVSESFETFFRIAHRGVYVVCVGTESIKVVVR